jgi:hypothetical protein
LVPAVLTDSKRPNFEVGASFRKCRCPAKCERANHRPLPQGRSGAPRACAIDRASIVLSI